MGFNGKITLMKRILFLLALLISLGAASQTIPGYTNIYNRYKWKAGAWDSTLHIPVYNGVPVGTRGSAWQADGAIAMDTTTGYPYVYQNGTWIKLAKFADIAAAYVFSNGITQTGTAVKLGGALTQHTSITGGSTYDFSVSGMGEAGLYSEQTTIQADDAFGQAFVTMTGTNIELFATDIGATKNSQVLIDDDSITIRANLGQINVPLLRNWTGIADTTHKKVMTWDTRNGRWEYSNWFGGGGSGTPGGSTTEIQYNNAGAFDGVSGVTSDGTNMTAGSGNFRATRPQITTSIDDANGNELIKVTATGSAVNEITLANAATGANPSLTASGGDTDVGFDITTKAAGTINLKGNATQAATVRLYEDTDDGTNYTSIKVPALAGNVALTLPSDDGEANDLLASNGSGVLSWGGVQPGRNDLRLTTETGVPVSTSDRTAQSTLYLTFHEGNHISLYNGTKWLDLTISEDIQLALSGLTSGKNYDVFAYNNSGTVALELSAAWTDDNTRADALIRVDGVLVKSGTNTRRYLGTIRTTSTTTTEDSKTKRFVWNNNNRVRRGMVVTEGTDSWSYTTGTWRQANGSSANQVEYVTGDASILVDANVLGLAYINNAVYGGVAIGLSSTTAPSGTYNLMYSGTGDEYATPTGAYNGQPGLGYFYLAWLERGGAGTCTFIGDNGANGGQTGLRAVIEN